ncbi:MAG: hypothetical protein MRK02_02850 [Candidatus Scalindua sp.]|nr:hypothetical protein [Candidatus Scalindua sp.]
MFLAGIQRDVRVSGYLISLSSSDCIEEDFEYDKKTAHAKPNLALQIQFGKTSRNEWSDIDIAMVSKDFTGVRFYDKKRLNPYLIRIDSRIETHPFRPEDFTRDDLFVVQILKEGIEITD